MYSYSSFGKCWNSAFIDNSIAYLRGLIYPKNLKKPNVEVFMINPASSTNGTKNIGMICITAFISVLVVPANRPKLPPIIDSSTLD